MIVPYFPRETTYFVHYKWEHKCFIRPSIFLQTISQMIQKRYLSFTFTLTSFSLI